MAWKVQPTEVFKNQIQKKNKNMKRSRSTYQPRGSCPALRNRCPRKLKNSSTLQSPREARHQKTAGSRGLELVMSMSRSRWSHQPRVSKLAEPGSRHDLSFFESFGRNQPDRKITILCKREKIEWSESYFKKDYTLHRLRFIFLSFFSVLFSSSFKKKYVEVTNSLISNINILSSWK